MAKQSPKSTNAGKVPDKELERRFPVPKGQVDAKSKPKTRPDAPGLGEEESTIYTDLDFSITDMGQIGYTDPMFLMAPEGIEVISQTARILPNGQTVVDVVIDVGPPAGATGYDVRIARAGSVNFS